jgi:hypothetical protein
VVVGVAVQVALFAAIHECAPPRGRVHSLMALGWMLVMAALTATVHYASLTITRRIDLAAEQVLLNVFWSDARPNLLVGIEVAAWHLFFGVALVCAAPVFNRRGLERLVGAALCIGGALCLTGLLGPALGNPSLRLIGVVGYGGVFPAACVMLGFLFRAALLRRGPESGAVPALREAVDAPR